MRDRIFILVTLLLLGGACAAVGIWLSNNIEEAFDAIRHEEHRHVDYNDGDSAIVAETVDPLILIEQIRKAANQPNPEPISERTYEWLVRLEEDEAYELLVELIGGKTQIPADNALWSVYYDGSLWESESDLTGRADFKEAVMRLADVGDYESRAIIAEMIEEEGWEESIPKLRELLDDKHLNVREKAASSLRLMTSEDVFVRRPVVAFPQTKLRDGMLTHIHQEVDDALYVFFLTWFNGKPTRTYLDDDVLKAIDSSGKEFDRVKLRYSSYSCFSLPRQDGSIQIVSGIGYDEKRLTSVDVQGKILWRREAFGFENTVIYSAEGPLGFVHPTYEDWLQAVALDGTDLWELKVPEELFSVRANAEVPDWVLALCHPQVQLLNLRERTPDAHVSWEFHDVYVDTGALLADSEGRPLALLGGVTYRDGTPTVFVRDSQGAPLWTAELPSAVVGIELIEPTGKATVIAAATRHGGIYLFDADGTLLHSSMIPDSESDPEFTAYSLSAGLESDGTWTLNITSNAGEKLFKLRP